ncbi:MAG: RtcB family protein, partial [Bacteroidota bacterium]|nr:RtcB family protein [Bacteroidota bacterium]
MLKVISSERTPIKLWLDDIEEGAMSQARNLANLPFAFHHIALMPDAHSGFGMPIGGVLATQKVVIPNAVGVDIGCGMCAMKTNLHSLDSNTLKDILRQIQHRVPVGADWHKRKQDEDLMPRVHKLPPITFCEYENALYQLGTLGGGNHFIEIQKGSDGFIWAMVHSGSRNIGKQVADHYNRLARKLNEHWHSE